jgi:CubicO group peptidase (beta-lactamase class C family)
MLTHLAAALLQSSTLPAASLQPAVPPAPALDAVVSAAAGAGFTGTVVVGRLSDAAHASPTYARSVGTDARTGAPIDLASRWRWASVTKQVTAVLVLQEVAAGRLALDAPIGRVLPTFRGPTAARVTGRPYHVLVRERLARGAGTRALAVQRDARRTDVASPPTADGTEARLVLARYGAAAAITAPLGDMLAFDRALASDRLLPRAWRDTLWAGDPSIGYAALGAWSYPAALAGCAAPVPLVERRGAIGGVQLRNVIAPTLDRAVIVATNAPGVDFGEVWQGRGLLHDVLAAALCRDASAPAARD